MIFLPQPRGVSAFPAPMIFSYNLGLTPPAGVKSNIFPIARMLQMRHRKIMLRRLERVERPMLFPPPAAVGVPLRVAKARPQPPAVRIRAQAAGVVPGVFVAVPSATPFPTRPPAPPPPPPIRVKAAVAVPGVFVAVPSATPFPAKPPAPVPPPPIRAKPAATIPGVFVPVPGTTPIVSKLAAPPPRIAARAIAVPPVLGLGRSAPPIVGRPAIALPPIIPVARAVAPVAGFVPPVVGATPTISRPAVGLRPPAVRAKALVPVQGLFRPGAIPFVLKQRVYPMVILRPSKPIVLSTAPTAPFLIVCTSGAWDTVVLFSPCDDFRVTITGPAASDLKISATLEFEEQ